MRAREADPVAHYLLHPRRASRDRRETIGRNYCPIIEDQEFAIENQAVQHVALPIGVVYVEPQGGDGLGDPIWNGVGKLRCLRHAGQHSAFDHTPISDQQRRGAAQASGFGQ